VNRMGSDTMQKQRNTKKNKLRSFKLQAATRLLFILVYII
jgi:hypothetical protein